MKATFNNVKHEPETLNLTEAAAFLRISLSKLRALVKQGDIPIKKIGRTYIVRVATLRKWVDAQ